MKIQVILGSTRPNRIGERVAKWVMAATKNRAELEFELVDLIDYDLPHFNEPQSPKYNPNRTPDPAVARWLSKLDEADGYIIITPEYNHAIPGILKDAIDFVDWQLARKPIAVVSYGVVGGARAAEMLKLVLGELDAAVTPKIVKLINPAQLITEQGELTPEAAAQPRGPEVLLTELFDDLGWWTKTLAAGRAKA